MADQPLPGYDTSFGNKKAWVGDHHGPDSYVTGGETFSARQLGWGGFDFVVPGNFSQLQNLSMSGTYAVGVRFATTAVGAVASVTLVWYVAATGLQVAQGTDLSDEAIRLFALGV